MRASRSDKNRLRRIAALALGLSLAVWTGSLRAEGIEAELKAAFIFNFAKYVDWPEATLNANPGKLDLCLIGRKNTMFDELQAMDGKPIRNRKLQVRPMALGDNLKSCQMLVVDENETANFDLILRGVDKSPVLTVNGSSRFLDAGGMISLISENDRMRFDINLSATRRNNLALSPNLLKLARKVR